MRSNYAALKEFKETAEKNELHAKREEILANENFDSISEKDESWAGAASKQDSSDNASSRRFCSARLSVCSSTYRSSMYAAISANSFPLI